MRLAVFGLGFMGSTHIRALQSVPSAELFAVVSDDPVKLGGDLSTIAGNLGDESQNFDFKYQTNAAIVIPFHPGAVKYFREKGLNVK